MFSSLRNILIIIVGMVMAAGALFIAFSLFTVVIAMLAFAAVFLHLRGGKKHYWETVEEYQATTTRVQPGGKVIESEYRVVKEQEVTNSPPNSDRLS